MKTIKEIKDEIKQFRDERNWDQYHNALDLAVAMSIECSEILELIRFKSRDEVKEWLNNKENKEKFSDEIADVFIFLIALCNSSNIDLEEAYKNKLNKNKEKYPVEKFYGKKDKYNEI